MSGRSGGRTCRKMSNVSARVWNEHSNHPLSRESLAVSNLVPVTKFISGSTPVLDEDA